jgi:hypothetical protein
MNPFPDKQIPHQAAQTWFSRLGNLAGYLSLSSPQAIHTQTDAAFPFLSRLSTILDCLRQLARTRQPMGEELRAEEFMKGQAAGRVDLAAHGRLC